MREENLTTTRVRLQKRWRRILGAKENDLFFPISAYKAFIEEEPICISALNSLIFSPELQVKLTELMTKGKPFDYSTEEEATIFGWNLISALLTNYQDSGKIKVFFIAVQRKTGFDSLREVISSLLEALFDYLDEKIDAQSVVLHSLVRFQQWSSWFGAEKLDAKIKEEEAKVASGTRQRQQSEKVLQNFMFEHLFLDGLSLKNISREPLTGIGRPDFEFTHNNQKIIVEVKLFGRFGTTNYDKTDLRDGVNQLVRYMTDYNCTVGYLVVFNREQSGIRINLPNHHDGVSILEVSGNRRIYVLPIAAVQMSTASNSPQPVEIIQSDLLPTI